MAGDWGYQYNALVSFPDCVWEPDYLHTHTVGKHTVANLGMAISANARRLFCPPDRDAIGLNARSPLIPNEPSW